MHCLNPTKDDAQRERILKVTARFQSLDKRKLAQVGFKEKIPNTLYYFNLDATHILYVGPMFTYMLEKLEDGTTTAKKVYDVLLGDTLTYANTTLAKFPMLTPFCAALSLRANMENYC